MADDTDHVRIGVDAEPGMTVTVRTPGGGGYGDPSERHPAASERDDVDGKTKQDSATASQDDG